MPKRRDIKGQRFGRLVVVGKAPSKNKHTYWRCLCDCGNEIVVRTDSLTRGPTVSCGCYHKDAVTKHGMYDTPIYAIWSSMVRRCELPSHPAYDNYGGRGIRVCERWVEFAAFYEDIGKLRPDRQHSLDRIDNDGDYCPENCRWVTPKQQGRNRRDNRWLTFGDKRHCLAKWAEITGLGYSTIRERLRRGWTTEDALTVNPDLGNRWKRLQSQNV